jgi:hypothetical protein
VATLAVHANGEAVEAAFRELLAADRGGPGGAIEIGLHQVTLAELIEAALAAAPPEGTRLGPLGERLLIEVLAEEAGGPFSRIAQSRGLRRSLGRVIAALRRVGVGPDALHRAAEVVARGPDGPVGAGHVMEIARALARYEALLSKGRLYDEAAAWRIACRTLAAGRPMRMLEGVDTVETHGIADWDGARLAVIDALTARGLRVLVGLPEEPTELRPFVARALEPALAALEARHAHAGLERTIERLRPAGGRTYTAATTPFVEARDVARRVRDLIDAGEAPEAIAVVAPSAAARARLVAALGRYRVPVVERRGASPLEATPVRIALGLYNLVDENLPRERVIALLSSRYVAGGADGPSGYLPPHRLARVLREAGVTELGGSGAGATGADRQAVKDRLSAYVMAQPPERAEEARAAVAHLDALIDALFTLPADGTLAAHAGALLRVIDRLQLFKRARGFRAEAGIAAEARDPHEGRAVARDQGAVRELEVALVDLPRAAARAGLRTMRFHRTRFARLLGDLLSQSRVRPRGARGAAVELGDLASVGGRRLGHVFLCALNDGELPRRTPEDPLLSDQLRLQLNRALPGGAGLPLEGRAEAFEALAFVGAMHSADHVHLSWSRGDEDGAPLLRSSLVEELGVPTEVVRALPRDPLPRLEDARTISELTARVVLECRGDRAYRLSEPEREGADGIFRRLRERDPNRVARLEHLLAMERQRDRFFAGETAAHPFVGRLSDAALLERLRHALPGSRERPLSASTLETFSACGFKFFLRGVLAADLAEDAGDELDAMQKGLLHHQALERFFRRCAAEGRLPLTGTAEERALLEATTDELLGEWQRGRPTGHAGLFHIHARRLKRQLVALYHAEVARPPAPGCTPRLFEHAFGPLEIGAQSNQLSDAQVALYLGGKIDRVDVGAERAVVFDYKTGVKSRYSAQVQADALCDRAWQLPVYAAAIAAELGVREVSAHFYTLYDAGMTRAVADAGLIALDAESRALRQKSGGRNVADEAWARVRRMREGEFAVAPALDACDRCHMEAACRVVRQVPEPDEVIQEGPG